jgi:hypothetical protein
MDLSIFGIEENDLKIKVANAKFYFKESSSRKVLSSNNPQLVCVIS